MSAFICSDDHIKALAIFAVAREPGHGFRVDPRYLRGVTLPPNADTMLRHELASVYATILLRENVRSVERRYPDDDPQPNAGDDSLLVSTGEECAKSLQLPALSILKMLACWEYQSCESDDFQESQAYRLAQAIKEAAIRALPGYDAAPWAFERTPALRSVK